MRLDRAGELNLLALAIGEVGGSKCRTVRLFLGQCDGLPRAVRRSDGAYFGSKLYFRNLACRLCRLNPRYFAALVRLPPKRSSAATIGFALQGRRRRLHDLIQRRFR